MSSDPKKSYPRKLFYKISEVAEIVGVEDYVLRYWETRFPMLQPEKQRGDQRRYRQKDIELLLKIKQLVHIEDWSINDAVEILKAKDGRRKASPPPGSDVHRKIDVPAPTQNGHQSTNGHQASSNGTASQEFQKSNGNSASPRTQASPVQAQLFEEEKANAPISEETRSPESNDKEDSLREELLAMRAELEAMREEMM